MQDPNPTSFAFFGTGPLAESVIAALMRHSYTPSVIVTKPDAYVGRDHTLTAPSIKTWATLKNIPVMQPEKLDDAFFESLQKTKCDFFIVASYGKIIPERILGLAAHGTLNVHPSLLPLYRGPSPIESALLDGTTSLGITIMKLDKEMDHGPILVQKSIDVRLEDTAGTLEIRAGMEGGELLSQILPHYLDGTHIPKEQNHERATFCKKIYKEQGLISLSDSSESLLHKWQALTPWPGVFFLLKKDDREIRVKVTSVSLHNIQNDLPLMDCILTVIPEGKKEMQFTDFRRGYSL